MATTTTNFGWDIPQSTDLVKDGAIAIAALGQDIDTAFIDLKGGTSGQLLSKASGTDLDYTWVDPSTGDITGVTAGTGISGGGTSGTVTITNSMATAITTAGDLIKGTGSGTFDRLGIGSTGQVLTVSGGAPAWATPAGASFVGCSINRLNDLTVSNNTSTIVGFDNEDYDTDGFHDNATNNSRITIPTGKGGKYLIIGRNTWSNNGTGSRNFRLFKNGTSTGWQFISPVSASASYTVFSGVTMVNLNAGDYIEFAVTQNSGGNLGLLGDAAGESTSFSATKIG